MPPPRMGDLDSVPSSQLWSQSGASHGGHLRNEPADRSFHSVSLPLKKKGKKIDKGRKREMNITSQQEF